MHVSLGTVMVGTETKSRATSGGVMKNVNVINKTKDVMGGTPVFKGTRVPVRTLIDYIEGGDNLDRFLEDFPTVSREQIIEVLELIKNKLIDAVA